MAFQKIPPINSLRAFEAAARLLSFKAAAEELCLTPSAISYQIKALEEQLGVILFERQNRKIALTPQGESYSAAIRNALDVILLGAMDVKHQGRQITLRLRVAQFFGQNVLQPYFDSFSANFPNIRLNIEWAYDLDSRIGDCFSNDKFDAIVVWGAGYWEEYEVCALAATEVSVVGAPGIVRHPLPITDLTLLADYDWVSNRQVPQAWAWWMNSVGLSGTKTRQQQYVCNGMEEVFNAVIAGRGLTVNDRKLVGRYVAEGKMVYMTDRHVPGQAYFMVSPKKNETNEALTVFRDWLVDHARKDLPCLRAFLSHHITGNTVIANQETEEEE